MDIKLFSEKLPAVGVPVFLYREDERELIIRRVKVIEEKTGILSLESIGESEKFHDIQRGDKWQYVKNETTYLLTKVDFYKIVGRDPENESELEEFISLIIDNLDKLAWDKAVNDAKREFLK